MKDAHHGRGPGESDTPPVLLRHVRDLRSGEDLDPSMVDRYELEANMVRTGHCANCDHIMVASTLHRFRCPGCGELFVWS